MILQFQSVFLFTVKSHNALVKHLKFSTNHEDFEMKKALFNVLVMLSRDGAVIPVSTQLGPHGQACRVWVLTQHH